MVPSKVYLAKGEKRQLVFWTDQDYSQAVTVTSQPTTTTGTTSTTTEAEVDSFLQAVNGQLPGFGSNKDEDRPFQFGNDNQTNEIDATIVNAELPDFSIDVNSSVDELGNSNNITLSTDLIEPIDSSFTNETEEGAKDISTTENELQTTLVDVELDEVPVTAANIQEVENGAWVEVPDEDNLSNVDIWPSPPFGAVVAEEEVSTIQTTDSVSEASTTASNQADSDDEEVTEQPATAAIVIELEAGAWEKVPEEDTSINVDSWPSPPLNAVIVEEELTTMMAFTSEIILSKNSHFVTI